MGRRGLPKKVLGEEKGDDKVSSSRVPFAAKTTEVSCIRDMPFQAMEDEVQAPERIAVGHIDANMLESNKT